MKLKGIISVSVLFIYCMMTFFGIGVIRCGCTNSQRLVMMSFHPSCLCSDSDEDCCQHNHRHHDENKEPCCQDENCCSLVYKHVDIDHLIITQFNDHPAKILSLLFSPYLPVNAFIDSIKECATEVKNNSPPLCLLKIPLIYMHSQLRL